MINDVVILIPCHSLEDFPTDLGDKPSEGILNAFAIAWHPWLLAQTRALPGWHRADSPPEPIADRLIIVPTCCDDRLPGDWVSRQREAGSFVICGEVKRAELLAAALTAARNWQPKSELAPGTTPSVGESSNPDDPAAGAMSPEQLDAELVADFLSLGTTHLQIELLSRQMHYFGEIDEMRLRREAIAAAEALVAGRLDDVKTRLAACFEALHEARERFYPTDSYLLDLCLLIPSMADDKLIPLLTDSKPISLQLTGRDAEQIANEKPEIAKLLREAVQRESAEVIGGEWREVPSPVMPLESVLHDVRRGQIACRKLFRREPTTWSRRRFGLHPLMPQLAAKCGYKAATHYLLDDGIYPDTENSKLHWEGCDATTIDAISRLPIAADGSTSYLRLPQRMAESMQQDQGVGLILARWPDVRSPFFGDMLRAAKYSPVIGKFVTFREFFERTDTPMRMTRYEAGEYLSPFLIRSVAAREPDPISRFIQHFDRRTKFESAIWLRDITTLLRGKRIAESEHDTIEQLVEDAGPDSFQPPPEQASPSDQTADVSKNSEASAIKTLSLREAADEAIAELANRSRSDLAQTILHGATETQPGVLIFNPLSFSRRVVAAWPANVPLPNVGGAVKGVSERDSVHEILVETPGCGFVWLSSASGRTKPSGDEIKSPLVEENVLRNEYFEVHINPETGGIAKLKEYGRKPNRLSQQLAFRFPRERTITVSEDDRVFEEKTFYTESRCRGVEVISLGPWLGEVQTTGEIVDQKTDTVLATFRQSFRLWRGRKLLEIDIELDGIKPFDGDPWSNYFGVRWAWMDTTAALTRSVLGAAQPVGQDRFESPHYLEIADSDTRTTILMHGLPFHRKTGSRMCDSILICEGETRRRFRFSIAVESPYPLQAALSAMTPAAVTSTATGPPRSGSLGWFLHCDSPNVLLGRLTDLMSEPRTDIADWEQTNSDEPPVGSGFAVRLQETEGRRQSVAVRCFRTPTSARLRDFTGRTTAQAKITNDVVRCELAPFEIADLELRF